jgi:hypothetical protein
MIRAIHERLDDSPFDGVAQWGGKNPLHFNSFKETWEVFWANTISAKFKGVFVKLPEQILFRLQDEKNTNF